MINFSQQFKRLVPRTLRNALRAPRQTLQAMKLCWNYRLGQYVTVKVRPDWEVKCHPASAAAFLVHCEVKEVRQELDGFVRSVSRGMTLLDIGSHHGVSTLAAIRYGEPESFVIAVDPLSDINPIFKANVRLSQVSH